MEAIGKLTRLTLGRVGEYNSRTIQIDVSEWEELFPGCAIGVLVFPPASDKFPQTSTCHIAATEVHDGVLTWTIAATDVTMPGEGFVEIRAIGYEVDGTTLEQDTTITSVRITKTIPTITYDSSAEITEEEPMQTWLNQALTYQNAAMRASESALASADAAEEFSQMAQSHAADAEQSLEAAQQAADNAAEAADIAGRYASLALLEGGEIAFRLEDGHVILYYTDNIEPLVNGMEHLGT